MADSVDQFIAGQSQQAAPQTAQSTTPAQGNSQGDIVDQFVQQQQQQQQQQQTPGEQTNEIGKTVIVPKEGESFSDTMKRAAAQGKKTTQQDINEEVATAPKKVAQVVAAAPVIGAAGTAGLAAAGEIPAAAEKILQLSETALNHLAENYPQQRSWLASWATA
jgi:hypothetical protein